jgi:hypothetical protein
MRVLLVALLVGGGILTGCGLVSGLSTLEVGDAGSTKDAAADTKLPPEDTGVDAGVDATKPAPEAGPPGIACGGAQCTTGQVCCATDAGPTGCASSTCPVTTIGCDDETDCPGMVCCLSGGQTQCATSCTTGDVICDPGTSNQCTTPKKCIEVKTLDGVTLHACD